MLDSVVGPNLKLKGISIDGVDKMVGKTSSAFTRLELDCLRGPYRIWCAADQFDLIVQAVFVKHVKDSCYGTLNNLMTYLRRQTNLISEMGSKCPTVTETSWMSMGIACRWIVSHRSEI